MRKQLIFWLSAITLIAFACQKELSFEGSNTPAEGSLQSDASGDCLPKSVNGTYTAGTPLVPATNTITVQVNVTKTGTYTIGTDTVNGYYFRGVGTFTTLGNNTVTLRGNGTPFANGTNNFVVSFDGTVCDIQVQVTQPGAGTLAGSPNACAPITVNGSYSPGATMGASQSAVVQVNVTTAGVLTITTDTVVGIWFNYTGSFAVGNNQNVTLVANGTIPAATPPGPQTFTVKIGTSKCTFIVNVDAPAAGTLNCGSATFTGMYMQGVDLTSSNTVQQIAVNVTNIGAYTITTDTVNGCWFNASGTFTTTGNTNITLIGHGTPVNSGSFNYTVKFGTSTCTFSCTFVPSDYFPRTTGSNWSYEWNDDATDSVLKKVDPATISALGNTYNIFMPNDGGGFDSTGNYSAGYYRKNSGDYFEWFDYALFIGYDIPTEAWTEYVMLKDNVAAGTNWKSSGFAGTFNGPPVTNLNLRFSYTVLQKDVPITITSSIGAPVTYQNVIVVEEKYEAEITPGVWQQISTGANGVGYGKSYYARGVGLILYEAFDNNSVKTDWMELRRYQVL